jgi:hypothetical protein
MLEPIGFPCSVVRFCMWGATLFVDTHPNIYDCSGADHNYQNNDANVGWVPSIYPAKMEGEAAKQRQIRQSLMQFVSWGIPLMLDTFRKGPKRVQGGLVENRSAHLPGAALLRTYPSDGFLPADSVLRLYYDVGFPEFWKIKIRMIPVASNTPSVICPVKPRFFKKMK